MLNWFDEQIRQRKKEDDQVFRDSLKKAAETVQGNRGTGFKDESARTAGALEKILKYYHMEYREPPRTATGLEETLDYVLHPQGMMYRRTELPKGWYRDAFGAYLGFMEEDGSPAALIPQGFGYRCYNTVTGDSFHLNKKTEGRLKREAYCFYRPLPQREISIGLLVKYILQCLRPSDFIVILAVTVLSTMVGLLLPRLTGILYGPVLENRNIGVLFAMAVLMLSVRISRLVIDTGSQLITGCIQTRLQLNVESAVMMRVLSMPPDFFREYNSGELSSRMDAVNSLCGAIVNATLSTGLTSLVSLVYITQIFRFAPALVAPSLVIILVTVVTQTMTVLLETKRQKQIMEQDAKTLGLAFSLVSGIQKIRLAGAEKRVFAHWAEEYIESARLQYNPPYILKISSVIIQGVSLIGTVCLYGIALAGGVSMKNYMAFTVSYGMVMGAFSSLSSVVLVFARIKPVLDMASPILKTVPETGGNGKAVTDLRGNIELSNVTFRYEKEGRKIIDNLSLKIKAGEYVAIVGPSGCGKSTLIRLLLGFEKPEKGAVFYDGRNLDQLELTSLRRKIGTVMQNGSLFNDSIYANITISAPILTMDDAWAAAETACIADDIREMPMGMFTMISEGQGGISGGQKQRLMIARAIAPKPSVLIFDEATSALDNIAQKKVTEALDELHCTRVVIAHRLSTIRSCGRILYLGDGRILEEGTYEELMQKNGLFADMVRRQLVETEAAVSS